MAYPNTATLGENLENSIPTTYVSLDELKNHSQQHISPAKNITNIDQLTFGWELLSTFDIEKKTSPSALTKYLGKKISLKGLMIPIDWEARKVQQFLLVPYIPNCMHDPLPGENQQILVSLAKGKTTTISWEPIEINGIIGLNQNKIDEETSGHCNKDGTTSQEKQMKTMPVFSIEAVSLKELPN